MAVDDRNAKRTRNAEAGRTEGETSKKSSQDEEMVPSSQPETDKEKEEELRSKMLQKLARNKQQSSEAGRDLFMEDVIRSNVCYDEDGNLQKIRDEDGVHKSDGHSVSASMEEAEGEEVDSFARQVGLGTQAITRINAEVEEEIRAEVDAEQREKLAREEELNRGKEVMVDETRRRTGRGNSEQNTMDKAKDRAKLRNLEGPAGNILIPSVSDVTAAQISLLELAGKVGIRLGNNKVEVAETVSVIDKLEKARYDLFKATQSKVSKNYIDIGKESKVDDDETEKGIFSDEEDLNDEDRELDSTVRLLAGMGAWRNRRSSVGKSNSRNVVLGTSRVSGPVTFKL